MSGYTKINIEDLMDLTDDEKAQYLKKSIVIIY